MYDQYFDEEAEYSSQETLRRAYALGVNSVCADPDDEAFDRLKDRSPDAYDRSIIQLAYEEGRAEALELEASETGEEAIWEELVETTIDPEPAEDDGEFAESLPEFLSREDGVSTAAELPESLDLPSFLGR